MPTIRHLALCLVLVVGVVTVSANTSSDDLAVGLFSLLEPAGTPTGWETLQFPSIDRETDYSLLEEDGVVVLRATSHESASALIREVAVDPSQYPYISWSWRNDDRCFTGSWDDPNLDDFPARLFVMFEGGGGVLSFFRRLRRDVFGDALMYLPVAPRPGEDEHASHLSDRIKVVSLGDARDDARGWDRFVRDVQADYVALFGRSPKQIRAIAVMTDTDNSATRCVSYFGDISFSETRPSG